MRFSPTAFFMKILALCFLALNATAFAQVVKIPPRGQVPKEVLLSAQRATQRVADAVVRGDLSVPIRLMYPEWKKKQAAKSGGIKKLERSAKKTFEELRAAGVQLKVMRAEQPYSAFEVDFGLEGGKGVYRKWLVFVPTTSIMSAINHVVSPPEMIDIRMESYQVAISDKGALKWTFLDGNQIEAFQLRQLFPFLPRKNEDLGLPRVGGKTIKKR